MSFPRYPKYKDSGVEWLGQVPNHWDIWKLGHAFALIGSGTTPRSDNQDYYDGGDIPWVNTGDLNDGELDDCEKRITALALAQNTSLKTYPAGSLVIAMYGATIGKLAVLRFPATVNQACCVFASGTAIELKFMFYWFIGLRHQILSLATGGGQPNISQEILRSLRVASPTIDEQVQIAAFLDLETRKIDELVATQQRLLDLLNEKRQAVVSHAVTKGLNSSAPTKPSGIEWLGTIPEHWEVRRLSTLSTKITNGYVGPTRNILTDDGIRYLQSLHIKENEIRFEVPYFVSEEWSSQHSKSILETGDVLIVQTGDIGQVAVVTEEFAGCNCHALIVVGPVRSIVDGNWISWVLNSDYGFHSLLSIQTGALHPHLNCGDVKDIAIPLPPVDEQRSIAANIVRQTRDIDALISETRQAIGLLQERRAALISAAVTGQIDVRGLAMAEAA